ncbi:MAG: hypothetical protein K8R85_15635 [Bacteroidetes bacterium]|nr:hypothetical protein [Bacteroidota bacterium]
MHARKNNLKVTTVNREDYKSDSDKPVGFELMTIATLKEELSKLQIAFDDKAKKADLVALLTEAKAK